jgi:CofH subfamily radical SAM domain protein
MILRPLEILRAARAKQELTSLETLILLESEPSILPELMSVADEMSQRMNGRVVTYIRSRTIHYTNVCRAKCRVCSFFKLRGQAGSFYLEPEEIVTQVRRSHGITQVTLTGGLNPDLNLKYHLRVLSLLKENFPEIKIQGYSPTEILFLSRRSRMPYREVLRQLKAAGLDSLSGNSAAILNDKIRKKICSDKLRTNDWIEIVRAAHHIGIPSTATMLFGHIENEVYISEHLDIIKRLQRETHSFTAFELQPYVPEGSPMGRDRSLKMPSIDRILKVAAISRLSLGETFRNIQLDWIRIGLPNCTRAARSGVNDLGALYYDDPMIRPRSLNGKISTTSNVLEAAISRAGKTPVERKPYALHKPRYTFLGNSVASEPVYIRNF